MDSSTPPRVLVVDDEKNIRKTLADILEAEGCDVCTADSGERALKLCGRRPFDVVLLDVRMRGIDGFETYRRIRRAHNGARVILMSAYSVERLRDAALSEGVEAFLRKPLDLPRLLRLIRAQANGDA